MSYIDDWEEARSNGDKGYIVPDHYIKKNTLYTLLTSDYGQKRGDILKLSFNDGTKCPEFINQNGIKAYCYWIDVKIYMEIG